MALLSDVPSDSDSDEYTEDVHSGTRKARPRKRRRPNAPTEMKSEAAEPVLSFQPVLDILSENQNHTGNDTEGLFEHVIEGWLPQLLEARQTFLEELAEEDLSGQFILPLSRKSERSILERMRTKHNLPADNPIAFNIVSRKASLHTGYLRRHILTPPKPSLSNSLSPLAPLRTSNAANPQTIDALYSIKSTPYWHSFFSRLYGTRNTHPPGILDVDWESRTPWMDLMCDVREHHTFRHPDCDRVDEVTAPITYLSLQPDHLPQVHDLLSRSFWSGIDVSDSLSYSPERCTVVATYKSLVVGAAFLSSPQETYITYLVVRAGWDNSQIATTMLYHLITLNPRKDITLHVSTNNPAMLLYNRFGFKAEEFVIGFYEDYLHPRSRASKNAFRLRLRQ